MSLSWRWRPLVHPASGPAVGQPPGWPTLCAVCRRWDRQRLCADCLARHATPVARCLGCGLRDGAGHRCGARDSRPGQPSAAGLALSAVVAAVDYTHPWDRLVQGMKYGDRPELARALAPLLVEAVRRTPVTEAVTLLVPVPLAPARARQRGYNQAWELARHAARRLGRRAEDGLLLRCIDTHAQAGLDRAARRANLRDALVASPGAAHRVAGQVVAVVDDVMTTGATLEAAAQALQAAGARDVQGWVLARTPAPGEVTGSDPAPATSTIAA